MPNGGTDCCEHCAFNRARKTVGVPSDPGINQEQFRAESFCTLRNLKITRPFWTYCDNFTPPNQSPRTTQIVGPVYAGAVFENNYCRIPWLGEREPSINAAAKCAICGKETESGIRIQADSELGFCSVEHYYQWWDSQPNGRRV